MTLEQRARAIADNACRNPQWNLEAFALRMLREAVDEALARDGSKWPTGGEMEG